MIKKFVLILALIISANTIIAQNLNDYKYVIVPNSFDFLKEADQYKLNSLTKFLLKKEGFISLLNDEKKEIDLYNNPCLGLNFNLMKRSKFLNTALQFELKNCKNEIVFSSKKGLSKLKVYKSAYHAALRNAFKSLTAMNYIYNNNTSISNTIQKPKVDVTTQTTVKPTVTSVTESKPTKIVTSKEKENTETVAKEILYAQKIGNGFQLVNNKPKVEFIVLNSGKKDVFILKNQNGILFKSNNKWIIEMYNNGQLVSKEVYIKF